MTYLYQFLAGLLGMLLHAGMKMREIDENTPKEVNIKKIIFIYLRQEWTSIFMSFIGLGIGIMIHREFASTSEEELAKHFPSDRLFMIKMFNLSTFTGVMFMFDSILTAIQGSAQKIIDLFSKK